MLTQTDLSQIKNIVEEVVEEKTKKELKKINKKLDITIKFFDDSWRNHENRLDRVDSVLHLPKIDPLQYP